MVIGSKRAGTILQTGIYQAWNGGIPGLKPGVNRFRTGVYQVPKGGVTRFGTGVYQVWNVGYTRFRTRG